MNYISYFLGKQEVRKDESKDDFDDDDDWEDIEEEEEDYGPEENED